jgi:hypothetical protein
MSTIFAFIIVRLFNDYICSLGQFLQHRGNPQKLEAKQ